MDSAKSAVPTPLDPINVEATRDEYLIRRGFYMRRTSEQGTFLDPAAVEKKAVKAKLATGILLGIPGLRIYRNAPQVRNCQTTPESGDLSSRFAPRIYIDGVESKSDMMWFLQPNDVLAVELYMGPAQIPLQYGGTNTPCGVLLIWTKH
ncbi:MAG: hypothetical protein EXR93_02660 [Gemmatimonadetes bacterium]|nr:hypothetical protein [Gemmatimonadota bacterium]